jgi:hypothetical protein
MANHLIFNLAVIAFAFIILGEPLHHLTTEQRDLAIAALMAPLALVQLWMMLRRGEIELRSNTLTRKENPGLFQGVLVLWGLLALGSIGMVVFSVI